MKTKYLDNEIELLNAIKRNDELSDYGKEKLSEFNEIKKALAILSVSKRFNLPNFATGVMVGLVLALIITHIVL